MKIITINSIKHGKYEVFVDDEDYDKVVNQCDWCISKYRRTETCYAIGTLRIGVNKFTTIKMHRLIMGVTNPKDIIDHRDGNGLNNQKSNLRKCTQGQNMANRKGINKNKKSSKYFGSYFIKRINRWGASLKSNGKYVWLGYYNDELSAAKAYDAGAKLHHGEFAHLNFPENV